MPSVIFGNAPALKDILSGLVDRRIKRGCAGIDSTGDWRPDCSVTGLKDRGMASDIGQEEDPLWCEIIEERLLDSGLLNISGPGSAMWIAGSDITLVSDVPGGRVEDSELEGDRLFEFSMVGESIEGALCRVLESDRWLMNEIVRDRLKTGFSAAASIGASGFLTSGSLYSSFPFLSEAKYSSPRPNTTCSEAKSRVVSPAGNSQSLSASGRS